MTPGRRLGMTAAATALAVFAIILSSYLVARTPRDVLGGPLVTAPAAATGSGEVAYTLQKDRSAAQIGDDLQQLGVITSGPQLKLLVSLMGLQSKLSAGDYQFRRGLSTLAAIEAITVKDSVPTVRVTFPEGIRYEEMAEVAEKAGIGTAQQFIDAVKQAKLPPELANDLPPGADLQGFLFPDTYILPLPATSQQLVDLMLKTFAAKLTPTIRSGFNAKGLSVLQGVTVASIVEREAVLESERPLIAGVFYNRISAKDLIGADPTVQFAVAIDPSSVKLFGWWKKELTAIDLENPSRYNTRKVAGIPPGPITNPGLASIQAVASPTTTRAYFFVADARKGDGSHVFAETFDEHERNIALYGAP